VVVFASAGMLFFLGWFVAYANDADPDYAGVAIMGVVVTLGPLIAVGMCLAGVAVGLRLRRRYRRWRFTREPAR
jgi:hypothetical protein